METQTALVTGNSTIDHVLAILGALVPLFSAIASFINWKIRTASAAGQPVSTTLAAVGSAANVVAVNLDKAKQLADMALGKPVQSTQTSQPSEPAPAPAAAPAAPVEPPKAG